MGGDPRITAAHFLLGSKPFVLAHLISAQPLKGGFPSKPSSLTHTSITTPAPLPADTTTIPRSILLLRSHHLPPGNTRLSLPQPRPLIPSFRHGRVRSSHRRCPVPLATSCHVDCSFQGRVCQAARPQFRRLGFSRCEPRPGQEPKLCRGSCQEACCGTTCTGFCKRTSSRG